MPDADGREGMKNKLKNCYSCKHFVWEEPQFGMTNCIFCTYRDYKSPAEEGRHLAQLCCEDYRNSPKKCCEQVREIK